jgi:hypothetical protein
VGEKVDVADSAASSKAIIIIGEESAELHIVPPPLSSPSPSPSPSSPSTPHATSPTFAYLPDLTAFP